MEKDSKYLIEECRHCGNKTKLDILGHYQEVSNDYTDIQYTIDWYLLKCCFCEQVSFASIYSGEDTQFINSNGEIDYEDVYETKYPVETYQGTNVPDKVNSAFSSALKAHYVDNVICLIALRRTLEIICKDKGATKGRLENKILSLTQQGIFPQVINEASDVLRILGNEAAHGDDIEYDEHTIKEMINFTQIIIEYVYAIPYRIQRIKTRLGKTKLSTHQ